MKIHFLPVCSLKKNKHKNLTICHSLSYLSRVKRIFELSTGQKACFVQSQHWHQHLGNTSCNWQGSVLWQDINKALCSFQPCSVTYFIPNWLLSTSTNFIPLTEPKSTVNCYQAKSSPRRADQNTERPEQEGWVLTRTSTQPYPW